MLFFRKKKKEAAVTPRQETPAAAPKAAAPLDEMQLAHALLTMENDPFLTNSPKKEVISLFHDEDVLFFIAMEAKNSELRLEAGKALQDFDRLTQFALDMPDLGCWQIMEKFQKAPDGIERLKRIATEAREPKVRETAMSYRAKYDGSSEVQLDYARLAKTDLPLFRINDMELLNRAAAEDESDFIRNSIARLLGGKLTDNTLLTFILRTDNDIKTRAQSAALLLKRDFADPDGKLDALLPELMPHWDDLVFEMGSRGDSRAIPALAEAAKGIGYGMVAPSILGNIHTIECVNVLMDMMQSDNYNRYNHTIGFYAAESLKRIYRETNDPAIKSAINAIPRKTYYEHIDQGDHGRSCHADQPMIVFDLEEEP